MAITKPQSSKPERTLRREDKSQKPFSTINYYLMGGCLLLIVAGFLLMAGGGSSIEGGFNPDIFSFRRIVLGPTLAFLGFLLMAFAIVWNPRKKSLTGKEETPEPEKTA